MEKTRAYLESLTTRELARMADREGIDILPGLERVFIIQELLENSNEEIPENPQEPEGRQAKLCPVPLPKQYNITYLDILIRDPLWVFAFWEINGPEKERFEASPDFDGYCLRVLSLEKDSEAAAFMVQVDTVDNAWYVGFPPSGGLFRIELCLRQKNEPDAFRALAFSPSFSMPHLFNSPENEVNLKNPLVRLSGAAHFSVIRPAQFRAAL